MLKKKEAPIARGLFCIFLNLKRTKDYYLTALLNPTKCTTFPPSNLNASIHCTF